MDEIFLIKSLAGARLPWRNIPLDPLQDSQEEIDFCLEQCPYASGECVNCLSCGGGARGSRGRPSKFDPEALREQIALQRSNSEICAYFHISRASLANYKRRLLAAV